MQSNNMLKLNEEIILDSDDNNNVDTNPYSSATNLSTNSVTLKMTTIHHPQTMMMKFLSPTPMIIMIN